MPGPKCWCIPIDAQPQSKILVYSNSCTVTEQNTGVFQLMHSHRAKYWCIPNKVSNGAHSLVMGDISSHRLSLNNKGCWGTTDDCVTSFLHFSLLSTALWDLANSRPVHSLMLSSHLFLCLPCLLPPFTVPCRMVLARPDEQGT